MRTSRLLGSLALIGALAASPLAPATAAPAERAIKFEKNFAYEGGTDLDFQGNLIYAGVEGSEGRHRHLPDRPLGPHAVRLARPEALARTL